MRTFAENKTMMHEHAHHHHTSGGRMLAVTLLNAVITLAEFVGGMLANSLSLVSDAVHNLGDTLSMATAYVAQRIGNRRADMRHTFGWKRAEIIAAFANAAALIAICLFLLHEAWTRFNHPEPIKGALMMGVAIVGLAANLLSVFVLRGEHHHGMNARAAYLHLLGDTLSSVAVVAGGLAIWRWGAAWLDPLITVLVALYIMYHTWHVLSAAVDILMQSAPGDIDVPAIVEAVERMEGIRNIHHLHLWRLDEERVHFEAHINVESDVDMRRAAAIREAVEALLASRGIRHSTLQIGLSCCEPGEALIVDEGRE